MRITELFLQLLLLQWKNFLQQIRNPISTIVEFCVPIVGFVVILILKVTVFSTEEICLTSYTTRGLQLSSTLESLLSSVTILCNFTYYYTPDTPQTARIIANASSVLNTKFSTVEFIAVSSEAELEVLANEQVALYNDLDNADHPATCAATLMGIGIFRPVIAGVIFEQLEPDIVVSIRLDPTKVGSEIQTPVSFPGVNAGNNYRDEGFISLQDAITQSIIGDRVSNLSSAYTHENLPIDIRQMPYPAYLRDSFLQFVKLILGVLLVFGFTLSAGLITKEIVYEKETRLRESMLIMGLSKTVNWVSWYVKQLTFLSLIIIIIALILNVGGIFGFSDFSIIFLLLFLYINAMISFSFLISTLFNSAKLSLVASIIAFFFNFLPFLFLFSRYDEAPAYVKVLLCLLSNSCLLIGREIISRREEEQVGQHWYNIATTKENFENFPLLYVYIMLIVDTIIYLLLTWYLDEVFPKEYGFRRPLYFPFTSEYWCGKQLCNSQLKEDKDEQDLAEDAFEHESADLRIGIGIKGLCKNFGKKRAVQNLNLNMFSGQITSLLGHNGAGKSTTISMLTGLYPPTSGKAYINDLDISKDFDQIRKNLGICPQHNVLIERLTVKEHMHFFIRLKGVWSWKKAKEEVSQMMKDTRLEDKANNLSHQLSGGMKRRLSVALALIGGSETVILDEPTSGLDPQARRTIWDLLEKYKEGRTIVLTTHFMDEADILGDRIAILASGSLIASGSSLFLKSRFGVGYHLIMSKNNCCNPSRVFDIVKHYVPDAMINDLIGSELSFILPSKHPSTFVKLFQFLEESRAEVGIESYGCTLTTLEEVFRRVSDPNFVAHEKKRLHRRSTFHSLCQGSIQLEQAEEICMLPVGHSSPYKESFFQPTCSIELKPLGEICETPTSETSRKYPKSDSKFSVKTITAKVECKSNKSHPRLDSIKQTISLSKTDTYPPFRAKEHEELQDIPLNSGITLRFQQIVAVLLKRIIYTYKRLGLLLLQILMPLVFTFAGLIVLYTNSITFTNELELNIDNTMVSPSLASLYYMDTPQTLNTLPNQFNLNLLGNFSLSNGLQTATNVLDSYQSLIDSVGNYTNASQCCAYDYQILDQFCANSLVEEFISIDYCSSLNPNFGYTHCTACLNCLSAPDIICPVSPKSIYNPVSPDLFSVVKQGPLEVRTTYIDEFIIRASTNDRLNFFEQYLMAVTTNLLDPNSLVSQCLCCSEFSTVTSTNETTGTCSSAYSDTGNTCLIPGVGQISPDTTAPLRVTLWYNNQVQALVAVGLRILHEYQLFSLWESYNLTGPVPSIRINNHPLPSIGIQVVDITDILNIIVAPICFVFGLSFLASSFVVFLLEEKNNRSKYLQFISGLHSTSYWIGNLILDFSLAATVIIIVFIPFTFFPDLPFHGENLVIIFLLQASFIFSSVPIGYLASLIFESPLNAFASMLMFHFLLYIILNIITTLLGVALSDNSLSITLQYIFTIFPSYALGTGISNLYTNEQRLSTCSQSPSTLETCRTLGFNVVESLYTFENPGILENIVLPALIGLVILFCIPFLDNLNRLVRAVNKLSSTKYKVGNFENEDDDVSEERRRVEAKEGISDNAIVMRNLSKVFQGNYLIGRKAKHAVKHLSIGLNYGECFGLLGVNGAGKTTTFEMLTGNLTSTAGEAKIHGFNVKTQLSQVRQRVGYCPQFDALQGYLNSYQLLTLYARIRGVHESKIAEVVQTEISRMDLEVHARFQCGTYSGGNKRKLSTAAALIGNAPVLLLDEPTTGMDPSTRRFFWNVVNDITRGGRCIVLTTHSMEECEALCTRLAIMVNGEFKCLGNVQYLKTKFGEGFTLNFKVREVEDTEEQARYVSDVKEFMEYTFPESTLLSEHSLALDYHLVGDGLLYSEIFEILEENKERLNITDYGVSQTTLEQIFLDFAKHQVIDEKK